MTEKETKLERAFRKYEEARAELTELDDRLNQDYDTDAGAWYRRRREIVEELRARLTTLRSTAKDMRTSVGDFVVSVRRGRASIDTEAAIEYLREAGYLDDFLERGIVTYSMKMAEIAANLSADELQEIEEEAVNRGDDTVIVGGPIPNEVI